MYKNEYQAKCGLNGRIIYLGTFPTPVSAHAAYCEFAHKHYGEFFFSWDDERAIRIFRTTSGCNEFLR